MNASMVWTLLCVAADIHVQQVIHIAGVDNDKCDRLSRRGAYSTLFVTEEASMGCGALGAVEVSGNESLMGVLRLCDPSRKMTTESEFVSFWSGVRGAIAEFLHCLTHRLKKPPAEIALESDPRSPTCLKSCLQNKLMR
jgi:hypothetical protein